MCEILVKNGHIIDPSQSLDEKSDILIENDLIKALGKNLSTSTLDATVIDANGKIVAPGLIDMHVHFRQPGEENEETFHSGAEAAIAGGFTSVAHMPNTDPPIDNEASAAYVYYEAQKVGLANIFPIGTISKGRKGKELSEIGRLHNACIVGLSDDGNPVADSSLMLRAMQYASMYDLVIIDHCEDVSLSHGGVMHEGFVSTLLGMPAIPIEAETVMIARDIILAKKTGARLHIAHVSTKDGLKLIRQAKSEGVPVTCEVTPHHLTLTDKCVETFDPKYKMNPPLRSQEDVDGLIKGLKDGTIDVIASDHAPHSTEKKEVEFGLAAFGVIGLESTVGVLGSKLVKDGILTWSELLPLLTSNPARILGIPKGTLKVGADADVTILDPKKEWTIEASNFKSKSRNCPFDGWNVTGKAVTVIVKGDVLSDS